ncbi:MAG: hypothetical protein HYX72_09605 [Acidobacteria bacterium]|nr:hypothetical protein [Acidobacteriota bacterium]
MVTREAQRDAKRNRGFLLVLSALGVLAGSLLISSEPKGRQWAEEPKAIGTDRLVSIASLPETGGQMCQWEPASATVSLRAALRQERLAASSVPSAAKRAEAAKRKPVRMIRDPYSSYSAVAVDPIRNEVVLADENLLNVLVYDRLENTPPKASMSEPKRIIGGDKSEISFPCGLYVDPKSGDIYTVTGDAYGLLVFSNQAKGNVPPVRKLEAPHGTFGIAVDDGRGELFMTVQHDNVVIVFHKTAQGKDSPIRFLQGNRTKLANPHGLALDLKNERMFVANHGSSHLHHSGPGPASGGWYGLALGKKSWPLDQESAIRGSGKMASSSITVYPRDASGDTPPLQVIQGPKTQMNWPAGLAVSEERGEIYIANDMGDSILVFSTSANGDVAPIRVLKGPKTLIKNPTGVNLDEKNGELWVSNFGNHTATVYRTTASGDTAPLRVIRSAPLDRPTLGISNPHPVAYDSKREELLVPN